MARKNGWQWAEVHGDATPYGMPHLWGRAQWDADALRDALRPYVAEHLGAPQAVLVVDETGLLKTGQPSVGVARHESGTAGRVDNCQLGVCLTSAGPHGHVLLDRASALPQEWTNDVARGKGAGIPAERLCATKPPRAQQMLQRAFDPGVPAAWVTGERVYGDHRSLRLGLEAQCHAQVLAVSGKADVWRAGRQHQVTTILAALAAAGWWRLSAGDGAKGPRASDWQWLPLAAPLQPHWRRWLLVRRSVSDPTELTAYGGGCPAYDRAGNRRAGGRPPLDRCTVL